MNKTPPYHFDDLLVKYLLHEATTAEQQQVHTWLELDSKNRQYFNQFVLIWEESRRLASHAVIDENEAWNKFLLTTRNENGAKIIPIQKARSWRRLLSAAAFTGVILISFIYWFNRSREIHIATVNSGNAIVIDSLTDGTIITLNKNSSLTYDKRLSGSTRKVTLNGEAFFNVAPDKNKPFVISVNDVTIKVVGTSFNVKNINGKTEVIVESGIVQVFHKNAKIKLLAKEKVFVSTTNDTLKKEQSDSKLYKYFRTKLFVCDNTPLWQLVATLNEAYNSNIVIENKAAANLPLTTTFNEEPLDKILSIVTATLKITATQKDNKIILR